LAPGVVVTPQAVISSESRLRQSARAGIRPRSIQRPWRSALFGLDGAAPALVVSISGHSFPEQYAWRPGDIAIYRANAQQRDDDA
jgi:hypothetical protein